jgi:hypothetical protein
MAMIALGSQAVYAQQPPAPKSGAVISSSPGKVSASAAVEITATVTAIDKGTRTVTLKGPKGRVLDVMAGDEVRNFDQIRVGDNVVVQYVEALTLELKKSKGTPDATVSGAAARAAPGQRPGGAVGREIVVLADVVAVDEAKSTISLKGPRGNVVDLKVQDPGHFKVVKVGDQVEAVYTEAIAVAVTPAAKAADKAAPKAPSKAEKK